MEASWLLVFFEAMKILPRGIWVQYTALGTVSCQNTADVGFCSQHQSKAPLHSAGEEAQECNEQAKSGVTCNHGWE